MSPYINTVTTPLSINQQPPQPTSQQWRCFGHERLHRDNQNCVPISPNSPIIDTPSKYNKMMAKRAAASMLNNSQATQPTPSGPPAGARHDSPDESLGSADSSQDHNGSSSSSSNQQDNDAVDDNTNPGFAMPSSPPSHHSSSRIPETPVGLGVDPASSPPLPLLTERNLLQLNNQPTSEAPAPASGSHTSHPAASPAAPASAPSIRSLPSEVAHKISRLVLRTRINALNHQASERELEATRGALSTALARGRHEASRVTNWRATAMALLLLCLTYAVWCQYNSAEFEFIEECRRKWFGL